MGFLTGQQEEEVAAGPTAPLLCPTCIPETPFSSGRGKAGQDSGGQAAPFPQEALCPGPSPLDPARKPGLPGCGEWMEYRGREPTPSGTRTGTSSGHRRCSAQLPQSSSTAVLQQPPTHATRTPNPPALTPLHVHSPGFTRVHTAPHAPSLHTPYLPSSTHLCHIPCTHHSPRCATHARYVFTTQLPQPRVPKPRPHTCTLNLLRSPAAALSPYTLTDTHADAFSQRRHPHGYPHTHTRPPGPRTHCPFPLLSSSPTGRWVRSRRVRAVPASAHHSQHPADYPACASHSKSICGVSRQRNIRYPNPQEIPNSQKPPSHQPLIPTARHIYLPKHTTPDRDSQHHSVSACAP